MENNFVAPASLNRIQLIALVVGIIGVIAMAVLGLGDEAHKAQFFSSYLFGYIFWVGVTLGSLGLLMVQHTAGGTWGTVIRRPLEAATRTLPLMILLFIPIVLGMHYLYPWTHQDHVSASKVLQKKAAYLDSGFFLMRAAAYFLIWAVLTFFLNRWSAQQDKGDGLREANKMQSLSGIGLVIFVLAVTFASVDWVMSLEPEWYSTIFGFLFAVAWGVSALALMILTMTLLSKEPSFSNVAQPRHFHDLGKLLLALVMLWAYFYFSQYLIIWSANLPEEITWYLRRIAGGWKWVAVAILVLHFAIPFLLLLSRGLKRNASTLWPIALLVFIMRMVDVYWLIAPATAAATHGSGHGGHGGHGAVSYPSVHLHLLDFAAPLGIGGLWLALFIWNLKRRPLIPVNDPLTQKTLERSAHGH
jgi:hypothetical protein